MSGDETPARPLAKDQVGVPHWSKRTTGQRGLVGEMVGVYWWGSKRYRLLTPAPLTTDH